MYELEFGIVIDRLLDMVGAKDVEAVQLGALGQCLAVKDLGKRDLLRRCTPPAERSWCSTRPATF